MLTRGVPHVWRCVPCVTVAASAVQGEERGAEVAVSACPCMDVRDEVQRCCGEMWSGGVTRDGWWLTEAIPSRVCRKQTRRV